MLPRGNAPADLRAVHRQRGFESVIHARVSSTFARCSLVADEWYRSAGGSRSFSSFFKASSTVEAEEAPFARIGVAPAPRKAMRLPERSATPARPMMA